MKSRKSRRRVTRKTKAGALLRACREKMGLTLLDVEHATGLLNGGISFLENGRSVPEFKTALILCRFYKLPLIKLAKAVVEDDL